MLPKMRFLLGFGILFLAFSPGCREPRTATSCSGVNQSSPVENNTGADRDPHFFRHRKKIKGEDGFKQKDRKSRRSAKKAEKGKKKEKETKVERKWHLFRKNREAKADAATKSKGNSRRNERKQKKLNRKRKRHPQMGLFPNGHPG